MWKLERTTPPLLSKGWGTPPNHSADGSVTGVSGDDSTALNRLRGSGTNATGTGSLKKNRLMNSKYENTRNAQIDEAGYVSTSPRLLLRISMSSQHRWLLWESRRQRRGCLRADPKRIPRVYGRSARSSAAFSRVRRDWRAPYAWISQLSYTNSSFHSAAGTHAEHVRSCRTRDASTNVYRCMEHIKAGRGSHVTQHENRQRRRIN